jgi:Ca2+-binding RTX toxin-like protein
LATSAASRVAPSAIAIRSWIWVTAGCCRPGADYIAGDIGYDYASYVSAPSGVVANLSQAAENTGDAAGDSYNSIEGLIGSGFDDRLTGNQLDNVLLGGLGNDHLEGQSGQDKLDGGIGDDTAIYSGNLGAYTVTDFGGKIIVSGPEGKDTLTSIEHMRFADTTLDAVGDGNPLFDSLFYFSRNTDVHFAGANALDHFNASGWHEGRDPNALFDTSGYLAVNKDVAAGA